MNRVMPFVLLALFLLSLMGAMGYAEEKTSDYERQALTRPGIPERGRALFQNDAKGKCLLCHKAGDRGGDVGPALTTIGGKFDRPHLIESLLEPSRQIVEGFRTTIIEAVDGRVLVGIIKAESADDLLLVDSNGQKTKVFKSQIEERQVSRISMMPAGLADLFTPDEFVDLVAYLETLRSGKSEFGSGVAGPISVPQGFSVHTVATGLTGAVAMETTRDGRILICEQTGALRVVQDGKLLDQPFATLPVLCDWERGLIGVAVHPDFPRTPYVYVCYVAKDPYPHHVVSRLEAAGDAAKPGSEMPLLAGDDQRMLGGKIPGGHQGGAIHFGPDGKLYIAIGDQTAELPAQRLDSFQGKLLRINADGSIPEDNPFQSVTQGKYRSIWALGFRNPFTFAFQSGTGRLLVNDVGGQFEEINDVVAGGNYGWPAVDHGQRHDARFRDPIHIYPQASIAGGVFVPNQSSWAEQWRGQYLFADFVHGWIRCIDPAKPAESTVFAEGLRRVVDLRFGADDALYVLLRNAWVVDDRFQPGTSSLLQIR